MLRARKHFGRISLLVATFILLLAGAGRVVARQSLLPIGAIQGTGDVSPWLNRFVNFRGVVVGRYEDENTRGDVYYTLFVQDAPDGDPATSDGIAVFLGRQPRPDIALGDQVWVGGKVTEFFGLTEIDDNGLVLTVEQSGGPLPAPVVIDPPAEMDAQAAYFEALESMRVAFAGGVVVAGPTHTGCGFAVIDDAAAAALPVSRRADDDPTGRVVPVLYPSDLNCDDIPQVKTGDRLAGLEGTLTYNFDQFKIVIDAAEGLEVDYADLPVAPAVPPAASPQLVIASVNLEDYFDTTRDTDEEGEPVLTAEELDARRTKLTHVVAHTLGCPTLLAVQEVEHGALLADLAADLQAGCGFVYQVSHLDTPDARGIDNALLSDPRRVVVSEVALRPTCSAVPTGITDPSLSCEAGQEPLFGRPPLQVSADIDGQSTVIYVNHFKSKRGGEIETDLERIRQAVYLNGLAAEALAADPAARIIALGDYNDTDGSPALALLNDPAQGGRMTNALAGLPPNERYSYNFGGVVELIDTILLSPALAEEVGWATIIHTNTDFPIGWRLDTSPERLAYRVSDHDMPVVALGHAPEPTAVPPTAAPEPSPSPTVAPATPPTAEADSGPTADIRPTITATATDAPTAVPPATPGRVTARWPVWLIGGMLVAFVAIVFTRLRG